MYNDLLNMKAITKYEIWANYNLTHNNETIHSQLIVTFVTQHPNIIPIAGYMLLGFVVVGQPDPSGSRIWLSSIEAFHGMPSHLVDLLASSGCALKYL